MNCDDDSEEKMNNMNMWLQAFTVPLGYRMLKGETLCFWANDKCVKEENLEWRNVEAWKLKR